jgi:hypothetical protein
MNIKIRAGIVASAALLFFTGVAAASSGDVTMLGEFGSILPDGFVTFLENLFDSFGDFTSFTGDSVTDSQ